LPRAVVLVFLIWFEAASGCAGPKRSHPSSADSETSPPPSSAIAQSLRASSSARVYRVQEWAEQGCNPDTASGDGQVACHRVRSGGPVLVGAWHDAFVSLVADGVSYDRVPTSADPAFGIAIRFASASHPMNVLLSLSQRRLEVVSPDLRRWSGSFGARYEDFLNALATALPGDAEIQELLRAEHQQSDSLASGGTYEAAWEHSVGCDSALTDPRIPPVAVRQVDPVYPGFAKDARIQGTVLLRVLVGDDGLVKDVRILRSAPGLDNAAMTAVRQWVFVPSSRYDQPVCAWTNVSVYVHP